MSTPDVRVRLSAEGVAEVVSALKNVEAQSGKTAKNVHGQWSPLKSVMGGVQGVLVSLAAAFTVGSVVAFIKNATDAADRIGDIAARLGITATQLTALDAVARTSGSGTEALAAGLTKLNKSIDDLRGGAPAAVELFGRLGLSAKDFDGKNVAESFEIVAKAMEDRLPNAAAQGAVAMGLMGRGGTELLETLRAVAKDGLDGTIAKAQRLGVVLTDEDVAAIQGMNDNLDRIGLVASTAGAKFVAGLSKPATEGLRDLSEWLGKNLQDVERWGENTVSALKVILAYWAFFFDSIHTNFEMVGMRLVSATKQAAAVARGDIMGALVELNVGNAQVESTLKALQDRQRARLYPERVAATTTPATSKTAGQAAADAADREARAAAAKRDAAKSFADSQLALDKAYAKAEAEQQKRDFDAGLLSVASYYEARRAAVTKGAAAERAALGPARDAAGAEEDPARRAAALDALAKKAEAIRVAERSDIAALNADEAKANQALTEQRLALEQKVRDARGQTHEQAMADIEAEVRKAERALPSLGVSTRERSDTIEALRTALTQKLAASQAQAQADAALSALAADRDAIQSRVSAGLLSELSGNEQVAAMEQARLPVLRQLAAESLAAARALGDPAAVAQAEAFQRSVLGIGAASDTVHNAILRLKSALIDSGARELANTLDQVGTNIKTVGQFFQVLVSSMLGDLRRLSQEAVSNKLFALLSNIGRKKSGGSGLSSGIEQALALGEFATGGPVYGPGHGTSDSIPAWLSTGEYVVNARSVSSLGLPMMHALNRFGADALRQASRLSVRPMPLAPRDLGFAAGGLVGASAPSSSGGLDGHLTVGLDDGLVLKSLETPEGQRVLVRALAKNRRALAGLTG